MAVYTSVSAEDIGAFLNLYDVGTLVSAKGIAEGVENEEQLALLKEMRCTHAQGFLFAKPVNAAAVHEILGASRHG